MIQIKKSKYDNYCTCCRKPFDDSMEVSFSHKDYNDSVNITLCGKCRRELMEALSKADSNSALDHIHNVVDENEYKRGYKTAKEEYDHKLTEIKRTIKDYWYIKGKEDGKAEANCPEIPDSWIPVSERLPEEKTNPNTHDFEEVLCSTTFGDVRAYKFGKPWGWEKPHFWHGGGMMDEYVLAWAEKPAPWEGEAH